MVRTTGFQSVNGSSTLPGITKMQTGKLVDQYILMFRYRDTTQNQSKGNKLQHLHIHVSPDVEGAFNLILDKDASKIDVDAFLSV